LNSKASCPSVVKPWSRKCSGDQSDMFLSLDLLEILTAETLFIKYSSYEVSLKSIEPFTRKIQKC